jgi:hypothetical protein
VVEAARKHGSFDIRWPSARRNSLGAVSTAPLRAAEAAEPLDWEVFSDRFFPGRRRHNMEALTAYAAYTQGCERRTTSARLSVVPTVQISAVELAREEAGTRRLLAAIAAERISR